MGKIYIQADENVDGVAVEDASAANDGSLVMLSKAHPYGGNPTIWTEAEFMAIGEGWIRWLVERDGYVSASDRVIGMLIAAKARLNGAPVVDVGPKEKK